MGTIFLDGDRFRRLVGWVQLDAASAPGAGDDALIDAASTYRVTVAGATVNRITLDDPVAC
jgi:hypothetical protein